jgi:hypothetical protein
MLLKCNHASGGLREEKASRTVQHQPSAHVAHPRFVIVRRRPEPADSASRRRDGLSATPRLNPAESRR